MFIDDIQGSKQANEQTNTETRKNDTLFLKDNKL